MFKNLSLLLLASCISISASAASLQFPYVPDSSMTPGDFCSKSDSDYMGDAYPEKIAKCERDVTFDTKKKIYELYNVKANCQRNYTVDHFIPLSIGGSNHVSNLWPEAKSIKALRQNLELELFQDLRDGRISQAEAVRRIRHAKLNPPVKSEMKFCR